MVAINIRGLNDHNEKDCKVIQVSDTIELLQLEIYLVQVDALFVVCSCSATFLKMCQLLKGIILLKWIYLFWFLSAKLTGFCFVSPLFRGASKRLFCRKYFPLRDFLRVPMIQHCFFSEVYWLIQCFIKENDRKFSRPGLANRRYKKHLG